MDGLQTQQRLQEAQIQNFRNCLPESGQLVDIKAIELPEGKLYYENYFLAREYERTEPDGKLVKVRASYAVKAYPHLVRRRRIAHKSKWLPRIG